jgi:ribosomal protein S12 methylthiotransferase accessory factor YcaO
MGEEDIPPPQDGEDEEQTTRNHEKDQYGKGKTEDEWKGGMDILQSHHGDIPEQKYEKA